MKSNQQQVSPKLDKENDSEETSSLEKEHTNQGGKFALDLRKNIAEQKHEEVGEEKQKQQQKSTSGGDDATRTADKTVTATIKSTKADELLSSIR